MLTSNIGDKMRPLTILFRRLGLKRYGYAEVRGNIAFQAGLPLIHQKLYRFQRAALQMIQARKETVT